VPFPSPVPAAPVELTLEQAYDALYRLVRAEHAENILEKIEAAMIERALRETDGNHVKTAALLGITRATLRKRVDEKR
jgi:two-component system nitrogen regulation response regulator GlnG